MMYFFMYHGLAWVQVGGSSKLVANLAYLTVNCPVPSSLHTLVNPVGCKFISTRNQCVHRCTHTNALAFAVVKVLQDELVAHFVGTRITSNEEQQALNLLEQLLMSNPADRISVDDALRHPFFPDAISMPRSVAVGPGDTLRFGVVTKEDAISNITKALTLPIDGWPNSGTMMRP
jgi:serine/threonine protein kinase